MTAVAFARDGRLHVAFGGLDAVWTCRRHVDLPLSAVDGVRVLSRAEALADKPLLRAPGTYLPGVIVAGTYRAPGRRPQLWCVHAADEVLAIDLNPEARYERIVLEFADPAAVGAELSRELLPG
ncbi:MAG TPA: hypothetical protein VGD11_06440 [Mycobacteriales bacterium]